MIASTLRLFRGIPRRDTHSPYSHEADKEILLRAASQGIVFAPETTEGYNSEELNDILRFLEGLSPEDMNKTFHKSVAKVLTADMATLVAEQILHYFTTYGFEALGIRDDFIYIPSEILEIPEVTEEKIPLFVIHAFTKEEIEGFVLMLVSSGVALSATSVKDVAYIVHNYGIDFAKEVYAKSKNREVCTAVANEWGFIPDDPVDFLRLVVARSTGKTLLIKNNELLDALKLAAESNGEVKPLFDKYIANGGAKKLASIFNRYKPIFLAFRANKDLRTTINLISKLSKTYHVQLREDPLATVTRDLAHGTFDGLKFAEFIRRPQVTAFRKVRALNSIFYRMAAPSDSIVYRIRNGKSYATELGADQKLAFSDNTMLAVDLLTSSIIGGMKNVRGKKFYIPTGVSYKAPASEKSFVGMLPFGSKIRTNEKVVVAIYWKNEGETRTDLDFKLTDIGGESIGWDANYRTGNIAFSGDVTNAPEGATEAFYVGSKFSGLMTVNLFSGNQRKFKFIVARHDGKKIDRNCFIDPNKVLFSFDVEIPENQRQVTIGFLDVSEGAEITLFQASNGIERSFSSNTPKAKNALAYYQNAYTFSTTMEFLIRNAGGIIVDNKESCDVSLSPEDLTKNTFTDLF